MGKKITNIHKWVEEEFRNGNGINFIKQHHGLLSNDDMTAILISALENLEYLGSKDCVIVALQKDIQGNEIERIIIDGNSQDMIADNLELNDGWRT